MMRLKQYPGKHVIFAVDPGRTIGLAVVRVTGEIVDAGVVSVEEYNWREQMITMVSARPRETMVLAEQGPSFGRHNDSLMKSIEFLISEHSRDVQWMTPATWKGHPAARLSADDKQLLTTKHERDAVGMARVWLSRQDYEDGEPQG